MIQLAVVCACAVMTLFRKHKCPSETLFNQVCASPNVIDRSKLKDRFTFFFSLKRFLVTVIILLVYVSPCVRAELLWKNSKNKNNESCTNKIISLSPNIYSKSTLRKSLFMAGMMCFIALQGNNEGNIQLVCGL